MKIKFLGSGSAFVKIKENYHSNILITKTGEIETEFTNDDGDTEFRKETLTKNLLIDAGTHISESLDEFGYEAIDVDVIFISHNHFDHNGGVEYLGFKNYLDNEGAKNKDKTILFGDVKVIDVMWENSLKGNMESHQGKRVELDDYFKTTRLYPKTAFQFLGTEFAPVRMTHVVDDYDEVPAFGLKWTEDDVGFFFSGDTQFDFWRLAPFWEWADVIFQDCEFMDYADSVHAQFNELKDIPEKFRKKMWLYHYMLFGKSYEELEKRVLDAGFAGLVKKGQEFDSKILQEELKNDVS